MDHEHGPSLYRLSRRGRPGEDFVHVDQRQKLAPNVTHPAAPDRQNTVVGDRDELTDVFHRHGHGGLFQPEQHAPRDGQCQGQADDKCGSHAKRGVDVDRSAQRLDPGSDDVHSDTPSRDVGNFRRGAEAGLPDEVDQFTGAEGGRLVGRNESAGNGTIANPFDVDATAVVADRDDDAVTPMRRGEPHRRHLRLAPAQPHVGRFDPVVDGIADKMDERVAEFVDHSLVEFGLLSRDLERHALAEFIRDVADRPLEPVQERADRHHPRAEHTPLQAVGHAGEMIDRLHELGVPSVALLPHSALLLELFELRLADSGGPVDRT